MVVSTGKPMRTKRLPGVAAHFKPCVFAPYCGGWVTVEAKGAAVPWEYHMEQWEFGAVLPYPQGSVVADWFCLFPCSVWGGHIPISTPINRAAMGGVGTKPLRSPQHRCAHARLEPCLTPSLSLYFLPARCKAAPSAPASAPHPERSEEGRTQGLAERRLCRASLVPAEHPLSLQWEAPLLSPPAPHHHAGYLHPDVFCHHRPGDSLLHHLHAVERRWGQCGSASGGVCQVSGCSLSHQAWILGMEHVLGGRKKECWGVYAVEGS